MPSPIEFEAVEEPIEAASAPAPTAPETATPSTWALMTDLSSACTVTLPPLATSLLSMPERVFDRITLEASAPAPAMPTLPNTLTATAAEAAMAVVLMRLSLVAWMVMSDAGSRLQLLVLA